MLNDAHEARQAPAEQHNEDVVRIRQRVNYVGVQRSQEAPEGVVPARTHNTFSTLYIAVRRRCTGRETNCENCRISVSLFCLFVNTAAVREWGEMYQWMKKAATHTAVNSAVSTSAAQQYVSSECN